MIFVTINETGKPCFYTAQKQDGENLMTLWENLMTLPSFYDVTKNMKLQAKFFS